MKILYKPRNTGRTTSLVKWVLEGRRLISPDATVNNRAIAVSTHHLAEAFRLKFKLDKDEVTTFDQIYRGGSCKNIVIDDIEILLTRLYTGVNIVGFSMTKEED